MSLLGEHEVLYLSHQRLLFSLGDDPGVKSIQGDLGRPETWASSLEAFSPHCCVHFASEGIPDFSPMRCKQNLDAGLRLIDALVRNRVGRVVIAGTCFEYGNLSGVINETATPVNCSLWRETRTCPSKGTGSCSARAGIAYRWARVFFAYGPGQRAGSLVPQCWTAFKAGISVDIRQPRVAQDFVHVDRCRSRVSALAEGDVEPGVYNIGTGTATTVGEVVNHVAGHFGMAPPYPSVGFESGFWADTEKMTSATGWRAQIELSDGVARTLQALDRP